MRVRSLTVTQHGGWEPGLPASRSPPGPNRVTVAQPLTTCDRSRCDLLRLSSRRAVERVAPSGPASAPGWAWGGGPPGRVVGVAQPAVDPGEEPAGPGDPVRGGDLRVVATAVGRLGGGCRITGWCLAQPGWSADRVVLPSTRHRCRAGREVGGSPTPRVPPAWFAGGTRGCKGDLTTLEFGSIGAEAIGFWLVPVGLARATLPPYRLGCQAGMRRKLHTCLLSVAAGGDAGLFSSGGTVGGAG